MSPIRNRSKSVGIRCAVPVGLVLASIGIGCSESGPPTAPNVSGTITLNGTPLPKASVVFQPAAKGNPGPPSTGMTDDSGKFTLTFADGKKGAIVGPHRVIVSTRQVGPRANNPDAEEEIAPEQIPDNYRTEPPKFDVPKGGTDKARIELVGPAPTKGSGTQQGPRND